MNKFENVFTEAKRFSKLLGHMHQAALEVNRTQEETRQDFLDSKRTGHCAIAVQFELERISAHHIPGVDFEEKIRYSIVANNKINFLLEYPDRIDTFPKTVQEEIDFKSKNVFGGGIRLRLVEGVWKRWLIAVSGFHPKIDEACSIVAFSQMIKMDDSFRLKHIQDESRYFKNPYALPIAQGSNWIKSMNFEQCLDWGRNEILKK